MTTFAGRILLFPLLVLLNGCATVYKHPTLPAVKPRELALLPITVSLANAKLPPDITVAQMVELENAEGRRMYEEVYYHFVTIQRQKGLGVQLQRIERTDSLLAAAGVRQDNILSFSDVQLAKILGVDQTLRIHMDKTYIMSNAAAIALVVLTPFYTAARQLAVDAKISDGATGQTLWQYAPLLSGDGFHDENYPLQLFKDKLIKKFPYKP
jgi:hypothetical protein